MCLLIKVPAPKGASTHILAFTESLGLEFGNVVLVTPGAEDKRIENFRTGVSQIVLAANDVTPIGRAKTFRTKLTRLLKQQVFQIIHFRGIFEGIPLTHPVLNRGAKLIYEVNGMPSIEMKYHYPQLINQPGFIAKLSAQEQTCLEAADQILTVSNVNAKYLRQRTGDDKPILVVPNGADPDLFPYRLPMRTNPDEPVRVVYIGTTSPWQGIEVLITAVAQLNKQRSCHLTIVSGASQRRKKPLLDLIVHHKLERHIEFATASSPAQVASHLHTAHMTVAPLLKNDRNTIQGCCPLKIIEAMASGCPLIATNIPIMEELAHANEHYLRARRVTPTTLKTLSCNWQTIMTLHLACRITRECILKTT